MSDPRHDLGQRGEELAERFLRRTGLKAVACRYRTPVGELDLVMLDHDTVVFVEVKTRHDDRAADPAVAVGARKRQRLVRAAQWFLHARKWEQRRCRFDVVMVRPGTAEADARCEHVPDAFVPGE